MDSLDNFRERLEALEQQTKAMEAHTHTVERRLRWWRGMAGGLLILGLALGLLLLPAAALAQTAGTGSCVGPDACRDNTGTIGHESCLGEVSCLQNTATIKNESCHGNAACIFNTGPVKNESCIGDQTYFGNGNQIGNGTCVGTRPAESARDERS